MVNRFILNEVSYFGPGARKELPTVIASRGWKKALVVTDKGLMKFGVAKMVLDVLDEANIAYEVFDDVKPNPTVSNVTAGIEACKNAEADFIIAIGGGSSMDTAKMVNDITTVLSLTTFVTNPSSLISSAKNILDFAKMNPLPGKDTILNSSIQNYEMTLKGVKGSMVEYLVEQGSM